MNIKKCFFFILKRGQENAHLNSSNKTDLSLPSDCQINIQSKVELFLCDGWLAAGAAAHTRNRAMFQ